MISVTQSEFARLARGQTIAPGVGPDVEYFVLGIGSSARAAIRRIHRESVAEARAQFAATNAQYLFGAGRAGDTVRSYRRCIERYISLDGTAAAAAAMPTKGVDIPFAPGNVVRARPDVVLGPVPGGVYEARVLLWDDLALARDAAEMIALPTLECVRQTLEGEAVVVVWQLALGQEEIVSPNEADARRTAVEALLVGADTGI